jgi:hypothetical protein
MSYSPEKLGSRNCDLTFWVKLWHLKRKRNFRFKFRSYHSLFCCCNGIIVWAVMKLASFILSSPLLKSLMQGHSWPHLTLITSQRPPLQMQLTCDFEDWVSDTQIPWDTSKHSRWQGLCKRCPRKKLKEKNGKILCIVFLEFDFYVLV